MDLISQILALLKAQFSGVREDGLQHLASALALQVADKEEATQLVGKLTAEKVEKFVKDWRKTADAEISKANSTYEASLKEKYDFVAKNQPSTPPTPPTPPEPTGALTLEQIGKLIDEKLAGVNQNITAITAEKTAETRRATFVAALDKARLEGAQRNLLLSNYDRMSFKDDADFNGFMEAQGKQIADLAQEAADKGLLNTTKPIFGAVNKDGISEGVAKYIAERAAETEKPTLTGKAI